MLAPDLTYSFRQPKDTSGPTFETFSRQATVSDTSASLTIAVSDLPKDRMLALSNVTILGQPGLTQGVSSMRLHGTTPAGLSFDIFRFNEPLVTDLQRSLNWQGQIFLLGGGSGVTILTASGSFDAGVAANNLHIGAFGIVMPRANAGPF